MSSKKDIPYTQLKKRPLDLMFGGETEAPISKELPKNEIAIAQIKLPPSQPRRYFEEEKLEELSRSIQEMGILEPLLVRPLSGGKYELIAGERRYRAAQMVGLQEVPVIIREMDDDTMRKVRLIENLQREDLNPWEETEGIVELLSLRLALSKEEVPRLLYRLQNEQKKAKDEVTHNVMVNLEQDPLKVVEDVFSGLGRMGWESFVKNRLPLLNLPEEIVTALRNGEIEYTKAKVIAKIKDERVRVDLLKEAIALNWSLSEIQARVNAILQKKKDTSSSSLKSQYKELSKQLGTSKVWSNPQKQKSLEKLLVQMKALLEGE
ncbi:MAG: ParB/RepB/Spo0J family partition protein [Scytonema sp. PMC 1069.18]|nr:ParB/RepB/Spo0J family partition protein [Scytonema sp. PMC 1069.18]MEC4887589.1 ParB/RepB/Spo0J family partition protein [Scytonema sp. PMC 1070.18]